MKKHSKNIDDIDSFIDCVIENHAYTNKRSFKNYMKYIFHGISLSGKRVLDIGGGNGLLTFWAALHGATVVCVEPETEGSTVGVVSKFEDIYFCIGKELPISFLKITLQDFLLYESGIFDIILIDNAINHIDEESCINLQFDTNAQYIYNDILSQLYGRLNPHGYLIITDCDRSNFFNDIGFKSPIMPTIEWTKHQSPFFWKSLIKKAGFNSISIQWSSPNYFGTLGRLLMGNRLVAYFTFSHFRLLAKK